MYIKAILLNTNDTISNCLQPLFGDKYKILEFSHGQHGRGSKTTFSIADTADSSVAASGDLMEYSGTGIVSRSIRPILSRHFTGLEGNTWHAITRLDITPIRHLTPYQLFYAC